MAILTKESDSMNTNYEHMNFLSRFLACTPNTCACGNQLIEPVCYEHIISFYFKKVENLVEITLQSLSGNSDFQLETLKLVTASLTTILSLWENPLNLLF